ncbi:unnamed protein product [Acanthoscelides obtectus]|uniref:DNA mismatch repair protein n=1 Tax=Acanthoscelides obtectus TaxID=200917 RepID=A0A9P0P9F5_ACAOB|nr:unnamed protein product [Acanthoscelides obtectus]CAK1646345.1 Probable DNA mismatch repair protein Msh6 [Acanthoscelides obtectus]
MSKNERRQSNTLFNYFQSPKVEKNGSSAKPTPSKVSKTNGETKKDRDGSDSENEIKLTKKRSRIMVMDSSDSEDEGDTKQGKKFKRKVESDEEQSTPKKPKGNKKVKKVVYSDDESTAKKKTLFDKFKSSGSFGNTSNGSESPAIKVLTDSTSEEPATSQPIISDPNSSWAHNTLPFLKPEKIKDANRRKPSDPDYDPRTLFVPDSFLKDQTPAMRQWWEIKSKHMDCILFFKVGKFYELYHMDAVTGVVELGFTYMKGEFAHSGFPETAYAKMATILIEKGYKVARVEQTETPEMMQARTKSVKGQKVVRREICQISSKSTMVCTAQMPEALNDSRNYLYAICMQQGSKGNNRVGICFVETTLGTIIMSEFDDDNHFSRLLVLFAEYPPTLILTERSNIAPALSEILNTQFKDVQKETLSPNTQFLSASETLNKISMGSYFYDKDGNFHWPEFFKNIADDCLPKAAYELSLRSLGASWWYLKDSLLDVHVFSMAKFEWYDPVDCLSEEKTSKVKDHMVLDAAALKNLNLLGHEGSLMKVLDHCATPFGRRLLQRWICRPLCDVVKIKERQNAVHYLAENGTVFKNTQTILQKMPDLERELAKIHLFGNKFYATEHPDSRAVLYEAATYSKRKIMDLVRMLKALEDAQEIAEVFRDCDDNFLKKLTQFAPIGVNIDLKEVLRYFKNAFDQQKAEADGKIIPKRGVVEEYDEIENKIEEINSQLQDYLDEQSKFFGCKVKYFGTDKKRYQLEVPENKSHRATTEYQLEGAKKGSSAVKRYTTKVTKSLLADMMNAESEKAKLILDLNRRIFEKLFEHHEKFDQVIQCLTMLDVLCSLAEYGRTFSQDMCMPEISPFNDQPVFVAENGRYPCAPNIESFVPNDTKFGVDGTPNIMIITGPNMGGKSTLMRQVAIISIMAQMGSYVPASSCSLSLIDRVFTRLGAQDDLVQGQSTFFVELSEASSILKHATKHSLVIIDELGRGTSTHDGNAIATAYVNKLTTYGCRTMFSTHYHSLVDNFIGRSEIQLAHMACMVENEDDPTEESVVFLYKVAEGRCPKSYGFNAAKLAGLDRSIIAKARQYAAALEQEAKNRKAIREIYHAEDMKVVRQILGRLGI